MTERAMATISPDPTQTIMLTTTEADGGQRLDSWLVQQLPERSRSEIQRWIKHGDVLVNGIVAKASQPVEDQQQIVVQLPAIVPALGLVAEELPLAIVYEDADLLVIDKAAGMVVHPAPGHQEGTLVNAILHYCPTLEGVGGERRPGIVHRIDKETSGLLVVAKHDRAHRALQAQFKARTVYKEYLTLLEGRVEPPQGRIIAPIGRHPVERQRQAVLPPDTHTGISRGREAITDYRVQQIYTLGAGSTIASFSYVQVILHTGRTHQIRVHFAWRKHPVVGDTLYGYQRQRLPLDRQFLHAHKLRLRLPGSGVEQEFVAPLPADLQAILTLLEGPALQ